MRQPLQIAPTPTIKVRPAGIPTPQEVEEIARWWRRYGDDPVRELMLKEALEADGLALPEEKPEERARRQRLQAARERWGRG
jgi:hypothetical protein